MSRSSGAKLASFSIKYQQLFSFTFPVFSLLMMIEMLLAAVISLLLLFYVVFEFSIDASTQSSMLANPYSPCLLDTCSLCHFSDKTLCASSFIFLFLCLSSSFDHFMDGHEYFTGGAAQMFTPLMKLLLHFFREDFFVLLKYAFLFLFFFHFHLLLDFRYIIRKHIIGLELLEIIPF